MIQSWNQNVDSALVTGIAREEILQIKKGHSDRAINDITAIADNKEEQQTIEETKTSNSVVISKPEPVPVPPIPKAPASIIKLNQMLEIRDKLQNQNQAIRQVENEKNEVYMELSECKGIFKAGKRKQLQEKYDSLTERIKNMQAGLGRIVREYGYKNVDEFYRIFNVAVDDYNIYQTQLKNWESKYGEKSLQRKLAEKQAEVKKPEQGKEWNHRPSTQRDAR